MTSTSQGWLLAYDATCGTCRKISRTVSQACDGRLRVVPLDRPDVRAWRARALGDDPAWAPTLLRVSGDSVRAWTGPTMAGPLLRRLGPRGTIGVVHALGRFRLADGRPPGRRTWWRPTVVPLVQLCVGCVTAARLLLTGKPPVAAAQENAAALRWVTRNRDRLPTDYAEIITYPVAYQRAIFAASPPRAQSRFWVAALRHDRGAHAGLDAAQEAVFAQAIELAGTVELFIPGRDPDSDLDGRLAALREAAVRVFPDRRDHHRLVTLGDIRS